MTFNSGSRIPSELYPLIVEYIHEKKTLLSMLVSSRATFADAEVNDAERKLYHSIEFGPNNGKHILFLESVLNPSRPHLSGLFFQYFIYEPWRMSAIHLTLIKRALVTFRNLKNLRFVIADVNKELLASVLPIENSPFKLEVFQCAVLGKSHRDVGVMRFIASQPSLQTLYVHNISAGPSQISLQNLQNLNYLGGSIGTIFPLLPPSAPIDRIHWNLNVSRDISRFPALSSLRVLSISNSIHPLLSDFVGRFGNVEVLDLPSVSHNELLDLYRFPLHTLILSDTYNDGFTDFIEEIFRNMKFLKLIFVRAGRPRDPPGRYLRWDQRQTWRNHCPYQ